MRRLLLLVCLTASCGGGDKTWVVVNVEQGNAPASAVGLDLQVTLGGEMATSLIRDTPLRFPARKALEIRHGSGLITVVAVARDAGGAELTRGSASTSIDRGETVTLSITLGMQELDGGMPDAGSSDGGSTDAGGADAGPPSLRVVKSGAGTGTVTSSDAMISCGSACFATYSGGQTVTLMARATPGDHFAYWSSGPCQGASFRDCAVTVNQAITAEAVFLPIAPHNLVFVTSTRYMGNLGGLAGGDMKCQQAATAAGLSGTYVAWLSAGQTALERIVQPGTTTPPRGWKRLDGTPFADQRRDFIADGKVLAPLDRDEFGARVLIDPGPYEAEVLTGTDSSGNLAPNNNCMGFTTSDGFEGTVLGMTTWGLGGWTWANTGYCDWPRRLYCFGVDRGTTALTPPPVPAGGKRMFYSNAFFTTGPTGVAPADSICTSEAALGMLTGTYKALLATTTRTAASLLSASASYYRPDGIFIGTGADLMRRDGTLLNGPWSHADKSYTLAGYAQAWTGAQQPDQLATAAENCSDWTSTSSTAMGIVGGTNRTLPVWWHLLMTSCDSTNIHVYCVEQ